MSDVKYWDDSYGKVLDKLQDLVTKIDRSIGFEREQQLSEANCVVERLKTIRNYYKYEISLVPDAVIRTDYMEKKESKDTEFARLEDALYDAERHEDFERSSPSIDQRTVSASHGPSPITDDGLRAAEEMQEQTERRLKHVTDVIRQTDYVAVNTLMALKEQTTKINHISEYVHQIDGLLVRSGKLVVNYGRRLATDRFIQVFGILNIGILGVIIGFLVFSQFGTP